MGSGSGVGLSMLEEICTKVSGDGHASVVKDAMIVIPQLSWDRHVKMTRVTCT